MKKLTERLLMFVIGVPIALSIILFLPQRNHLVANVIIIILSALGAVEFADFLKRKNILISMKEAAVLGATAPIAMTLIVSFNFSTEFLFFVFIFGAGWLVVSCIFVNEELLKSTINRVSAGFAVMMYPGLFMMWIIKMNHLLHAKMLILTFLLIVFATDSAAWAFGMLFGKGNRGIILASPNKSIVGFIGGLFVAIIIGLIMVFVLPDVFASSKIASPLAGVVLAFLVAVAAILGDLGESAMKRSSDIKDSGNIIPGRGGVLDSIDSLSFAAPIYYIFYKILF